MNELETRRARAEAEQGKIWRSYSVNDVEMREQAGSLTLNGHASVYGVEYEIYGGPPFGWTELVEVGAGAKTLSENPDVQLLTNHDSLPLARTKSGTMTLSEDGTGLLVQANLEPKDPDVQSLRYKMDRRDLDEMSFAFRVTRQEWDEDYTHRTIREYNINRGDVSIVNYGANPNTTVALRSEFLGSLRAGDYKTLLTEARELDAAGLAALLDSLGEFHDALAHLISPDTEPLEPVEQESAKFLGSLARKRLELLQLTG